MFFYVSAVNGSDSNPGTADQPLLTISHALVLADPLAPPVDVRVGEGSYPEKVTLIEGVNILGGYDCSPLPCSATRDPAVNHSVIADQDFEGVLAPPEITRATTFDGTEVTGKPGTPSGLSGAALTVTGGSPTLTHNVVTGASITGGKASYGILVSAPAAPLIGNSVIAGGSGASAAGIFASAGNGTAIQSNDIRAGNAATQGAWGISLAGGPIQIDSNRINAAPSSGSCPSTNEVPCGGIKTQSAAADITNNIVAGLPGARVTTALLVDEVEMTAPPLRVNSNYLDGYGSGLVGSSSAAVRLYQTCSTCGSNAILGKFRNNVLRGGENRTRYGIYESLFASGRTVHPEALQNNDFFFPSQSGTTDYLYHLWNGTTGGDLTTMAEVNALSFASGNFQADCLFNATFHLVVGSPCINAGVATEAPPLDFEGQARPNGGAFDVGPDEYYP